MKNAILLFALLIPIQSFSVLREMDYNAIINFQNQNISFLKDVPAQATSTIGLWSDYYWPDDKGGIAFRWQHSSASDPRPSSPFRYKKLSVQELANMSDAQLSELSPAEKFDLYNGNLNFPMLAAEKRRIKLGYASWQGICDGVAIANQLFKEPTQKTVTVKIAGQVKKVTLYPADIKALLALSSSTDLKRNTLKIAYIGSRCDGGRTTAAGACWDANPANFFLVLVNQIWALNSTVIMDVDPTVEVWNSAIKGFDAKVTPRAGVSPRAAYGTVREVKVDLTVRHMLGVKPSKKVSEVNYGFKSYSFTLEISAAGEIIGGEWLTTNRPDFLWRVSDEFNFDSDMSSLGHLVERR